MISRIDAITGLKMIMDLDRFKKKKSAMTNIAEKSKYDIENLNRFLLKVRYLAPPKLELREGDEKIVEAYVNGYRAACKQFADMIKECNLLDGA